MTMTSREPWRVERNVFDGESLWVFFGVDLRRVPSPYQELLTDEHRKAYAAPGKYFAQLAARAKVPGMKRWLLAMSLTEGCELKLHHAEICGTIQTDVVIRGFTPDGRFHDFRLADLSHQTPLPAPLDNVYELIDGTLEGGVWEAGGLKERSQIHRNLEQMRPHFAYPKVGDPPVSNLAHAIEFYCGPCGDVLLADEGKAVSFMHDNGAFYRGAALDSVIDRYFESKLSGQYWADYPNY